MSLGSSRVMTDADDHLNKSLSVFKNESAGDAWQYAVSIYENDKTVRVINRGTGWRSRHIADPISETSLQHISKEMSSVGFKDTRNSGQHPQGNEPFAGGDVMEGETKSSFKGKGLGLSTNCWIILDAIKSFSTSS